MNARRLHKVMQCQPTQQKQLLIQRNKERERGCGLRKAGAADYLNKYNTTKRRTSGGGGTSTVGPDKQTMVRSEKHFNPRETRSLMKQAVTESITTSRSSSRGTCYSLRRSGKKAREPGQLDDGGRVRNDGHGTGMEMGTVNEL